MRFGKAINWVFAGFLILGVLWAPAAQAANERDVDFDWVLATVDTLVSGLVEGFEFPLSGVDNDNNTILDEDTLATLGLALRGGPRVSGLNQAQMESIRADFLQNRIDANNDMAAQGTGFFQNCWLLNVAGYPCKLTEILIREDTLGPDVGRAVAEIVLDLVAGYATTADTPATFTAVNEFLDAILDAFIATLDPGLQDLANGMKGDFHIVASNYDRWGAGGNRANLFGAAGNLDADANINSAEYGGTREQWYTNNGITQHPIRIITQPADQTVFDGETVNFSAIWVGGNPPFTIQWENAANFADTDFPADYGITTITTPTVTNARNATLSLAASINTPLAPWIRISESATGISGSESVYEALPVVVKPTGAIPATRPVGQLEFDAFGGHTSVFANLTVEVAPLTASVSPPGPVNLFVGQNQTLTAVVAGGAVPYTYQWQYGGSPGTMGNIFGQTNSTLDLTNVQTSATGYYGVVVTDSAAKTMTTSAPVQVTVLPAPPVVSSASVTGPLSIQVTFSANMSTGGGVNAADRAANYTITGPGKGTLANSPSSVVVAGATATLTWASGEMTLAQPITVEVAANVTNTNGTAMGTPRQVTTSNGGQGVRPSLTITPVTVSPTNLTAIVFNVNFNENVTGLLSSEFTLGNCTVSNFSGSGSAYTLTVTPIADGNVTVFLSGAQCTDAAGNFNLPAPATASVQYDATPPSATLSTAVSSPTNLTPVTVTLQFGSAVNGFIGNDVTVGNGSVTGVVDGGGGLYTLSITPAADGQVNVSVAAGVATDAAGNGNTAAAPISFTYDGSAPTPVITSTAGPSGSSTSTAPVQFQIAFGESVSGFTLGDLVVAGGAPGNFQNLTGGNYSFTVGPAGNGAITVDIAAAAATDTAGNASLAATQFLVNFNSPQPTTTITSPIGAAGTLTNANPVVVNVAFSVPVTGFSLAGVDVTNGAASDLTGSGANYSFEVMPAADGPVLVEVQDSAATDGVNGNLPGDFDFEYDGTAPTILSFVPVNAGPTNADAVDFTLTFSEAVMGLAPGDISVVPFGATGTVGAAVDQGGGDVYTVPVTGITGDGSLILLLGAGTVTDLAGNVSALPNASNPTTIDNTAPVITITGSEDTSVDCGVGYADEGATANDTVSGDLTAQITVSGDTVTAISAPGDYSIDYSATDAAGNTGIGTRTVTVTENCPLAVTTNGNSVIRDQGTSYTFDVDVTGAIGTVLYQWQKATDDGSKAIVWEPIPSASDESYVLNDLTAADSGDYRCEVSDAVTIVPSEVISLTVVNTVPVAGLAGLAGMGALLAALGARRTRKRA